ncbi:Transcriptional adapter ada2 [Kappamyces sp. JEL0680]|nr:Transcriptional adapter ada2 [Kappamyces sp. JEL0680]
MLAAASIEDPARPEEGFFQLPSASKKRKTSPPVRSVLIPNQLSEDEKLLQGICKLDVYSVYTTHPEQLLRRVASSASLGSNSGSLSDCKSDDSSEAMTPLISSGLIDMAAFKNTSGAPTVIWKKVISPTEECYDLLTPEEIKLASTLRVLPSQYLHIKETILTQVHVRGPFKKRDAKSWFRIDVNKTAILFDWFRTLGWIPSDDEWERKAKISADR